MAYTLKQLADRPFRTGLRRRYAPYFVIISTGRRLGYHRNTKGVGYWIAAVRVNAAEHYKRKRLGRVDDDLEANGSTVLSLPQAVEAALDWFSKPEIVALATDTMPVRYSQELKFCPCGEVYTLGHCIAEFLEWKRNFGARASYLACVSMTNRYIVPRLASIPVDELSSDDLRALMLEIESTPAMIGSRVHGYTVVPETMDKDARRRRRVTANNTFSMLRTALDMAWQEGKVTDDGAWRRVKRFRNVDKARVEFLSHDEACSLLTICSPELRRIILAALYTGCRVTELLQMRARDLNRQRMAIYVHPLKTYRGRHVALPQEGYAFFEELALGKGGAEKLLVRDSGVPWASSSRPSSLLKVACKVLGLSDRIVFHSLRHTYASWLIQAGTPVVVVARQLGHSNINSVVRTYAHCADDFYDEELRKRYQPHLRGSLDIRSTKMTASETADGSVASIVPRTNPGGNLVH
jgi:integrase/recombinase XerD